MRKLLIFACTCLLCACSSGRYKLIENPDSIADFGNNVRFAKQEAVDKLLADEEAQDDIILAFLDNYDATTNRLREYVADNGIAQWKDQVDRELFSLTSKEEPPLPTMKSTYAQKDIIYKVRLELGDFLRLYCDSFIDKPAIMKGKIILPGDRLVALAYRWSMVLDKGNINENMERYVRRQMDYMLRLIFEGTEDSPAFDPVTGDYDAENLRSMRIIFKTDPTSKAGEQFGIFMKLLQDSGNQKSLAIEEFVQKLTDEDK